MEATDRHGAVASAVKALALPSGVIVRAWNDADFPAVQHLSEAEGWPTPAERPREVLDAWRRSWPTLVALHEETVIGFSRALSDGGVTTYVAELLVAPAWRRLGIASALLRATHQLCPGSRLDLLATSTSSSYYERLGFRSFRGFRWSWQEALNDAQGQGCIP